MGKIVYDGRFKRLKAELKAELKLELRAELKAEIRAEIREALGGQTQDLPQWVHTQFDNHVQVACYHLQSTFTSTFTVNRSNTLYSRSYTDHLRVHSGIPKAWKARDQLETRIER